MSFAKVFNVEAEAMCFSVFESTSAPPKSQAPVIPVVEFKITSGGQILVTESY